MPVPASHENGSAIGGNVKQLKFDRQLRLWGADGQAALEAAHVVAIGVTPAIAETLKSLLLTGVPAVTLVDERVVTAEDVAANFFVPASSVGTPLATAVLKSVCALGEQCTGMSAFVTPEAWVKAYAEAVAQDWQAGCLHSTLSNADITATPVCASTGILVEHKVEGVSALQQFMKRFPPVVGGDTSSPTSLDFQVPLPSLILVSERYADLSPISLLAQTCLHRCYPDVPVVLVRSCGLLGFLQVYCPPRVVVRPHTPTQVKMEDLRIFQPFAALKAWFDAHNPDDCIQFSTSNADSMSLHSHLPYPCILHHAFHRWWASLSEQEQAALPRHPSLSSTHSSSIFPLPAKSYHDIASIVAGMIRRQSPPEDAFMEAMEKCTAKLNRPMIQQLPEGLHALLQDPRCADPLLAVAELRTRLFPVPHTGDASAALLPVSRLLPLLTSEEVLVWCVLYAVRRFVDGQIGCEERPGASEGHRHASSTAGEPPSGTASTGQDGEKTSLKAHLPPPQCPSLNLPLTGYLPDFTTTTIWYRELQDIYRAKHLEDVACIADEAWGKVAHAVEATATCADAEEGGGSTQRLVEEVRRVVKPLLTKYAAAVVESIWDLRMVFFSADYLATEEPEWRKRLGHRLTWITQSIADDMDRDAGARRAACLAVAYLCYEELQRLAAFRSDGSTQPRITGQAIAEEAARLTLLAKTAHPAPGSPTASTMDSPVWLTGDEAMQNTFPKACEEVARWAGAGVHLPSVAASTGALAAQEAAKLIMRIRVPCGPPIMYDGYTNKAYTL
ncbi:hypothetical protein ABL78_4885 [Leptomonas seymouri]|uniref:THIF-type NAD/FAD binding fold domain-containing protein n=1 Tax=Leptomonas seymouri TaxID=5684 RepID=A0A0N0P5J2_LEPSE|nr:hypothetical protein ABL78_4885 [Leptomonas seymouri]|eukprot:KPI86047.1 hypothetical protein ABL78_4885 [Leptomonas seymouri]